MSKRLLSFMPALAALTLMAASNTVFAAGATVVFDRAFVTSPGATLQVTLTDFEIGGSVEQVAESAGFAGVPHATPNVIGSGGVRPGQSFQVRVARSPILDANTDGFINFRDVQVTSSDPAFVQLVTVAGSGPTQTWHPVDIVSDTGGILLLLNTGSSLVPAGIPFTVSYKAAADLRTARVRITSSRDQQGFELVLRETGRATGIFKGALMTGDATDTAGADSPTSTSRPRIAVANGDVVVAAYGTGGALKTALAVVDSAKPEISIVSPPHNHVTTASTVWLVAEINDIGSGVDPASLAIAVNSATTPAGAPVPVQLMGSVTVIAIPGGVRIERLLAIGGQEAVIKWKVTASDNAGNPGSSDSNLSTLESDDHTLMKDTQGPAYGSTMCGDLNDDGRVSILDILAGLKIAAGVIAPTSRQSSVGDLNRDGAVNVLDSIIGLRYLVGRVQSFSCAF